MNNSIALFAILGVTFCCLLLIAYGVNQVVKNVQRRRRIIETIQQSRDAWGAGETAPAPSSGNGLTRLLHVLGGLGGRFSDNSSASYSALRLRLLRAGLRGPNAGQMVWAAKFWAPPLLVLIFAALHTLLPQLKLLSMPTTISIALGLCLLGFYTPELYLAAKASIRKEQITKDLPDALDLLVVCLEAGLGLDSAFTRVAEEMKMTSPELSEEFKLLNLELRAGKPRQEALRNLAQRADIDSLTSLVTLMIQTETFGTGITKALRVFADSFRTKRFQRAEEIAAKLPVKMLIPMVFFIFPTFMAVMVGPAAISIWDNWLSKG
jgi:tight adherence protein C